MQCVDLVGVHTIENAADAMTIVKAHSEPLFALLRTGMHTLRGGQIKLADRAGQRQTGTVPRNKVSAIRAVIERTFFRSHVTWNEGISFRGT